MASSSRMTAAMTCSCTSALSSVPALERCVKARRSPTKSWQIVALANLRPTICAPQDKRSARARLHGGPQRLPRNDQKAAPMARPFSFRLRLEAVPIARPFRFVWERRAQINEKFQVVVQTVVVYMTQVDLRGLGQVEA